MWLLVLACAKPAPPTPAPAPVAAAPAADAIAPQIFDAAALRDGFVLGTKLRLKLEMAGVPTQIQEWEVVGHTPEGCTIHSVTRDEAGAVVSDETGSSTWEELQTHGAFPAAATRITDDTVTVPAGTFECRRYTVTEPDGGVKVLHFAKSLPGPPVLMNVTKDGAVVMTMTLLERTSPR